MEREDVAMNHMMQIKKGRIGFYTMMEFIKKGLAVDDGVEKKKKNLFFRP